MTFLDKLDLLMQNSGLNKHKLSLISGVPYTTIDGFYKKGYENAKISTIRKIAKALGCSLDYLIDEAVDTEIKKSPGTGNIAPGDSKDDDIIAYLEHLDDSQKDFLIALLETIAARNQQKRLADRVSAAEVVPKFGRRDLT